MEYHIDYCFVPEVWARRITSVTLGEHAKWREWSDHVPLSATIMGVSV